MLLIRKLLVALLAIASPLATTAVMLAPAMTAGGRGHAHFESLAIEDGELHVVLHHHHENELTDKSGGTMEAADHEVPLVDHSTATAVAKRQNDHGTTCAVRVIVATTNALMLATAPSARANETPPPLLSATSILRI